MSEGTVFIVPAKISLKDADVNGRSVSVYKQPLIEITWYYTIHILHFIH